MQQYLQDAFSGPPLPASILLVIVLAYWLLVIVGMLDLDVFDLDLDVDVDTDLDSVLSIGMLPLKWLNIGRVPVMIWTSAFALAFWMTAMLWDSPAGRENGWNMAAVILRNGAIALLAAKLLTQPLIRVFDVEQQQGALLGSDLVGMTCVSTTSVTEGFGQAKVDTGKGAPLLINVRCEYDEMAKGARAEIAHFDAAQDLYIVKPMPGEV